MLAIRMQRTGRKGHAMFRVIVQDSHRSPASGKVVARLGSYDPHAKTVILDKEKAAFYLDHGAQPSERVTGLLKSEGVKLPSWVKPPAQKERSVRNTDKRRSTAPAKSAETEAAETAAPAAAQPTEIPSVTDAGSETETAVTNEVAAEAPKQEAAEVETVEEQTADSSPSEDGSDTETTPDNTEAEDKSEKTTDAPAKSK